MAVSQPKIINPAGGCKRCYLNFLGAWAGQYTQPLRTGENHAQNVRVQIPISRTVFGTVTIVAKNGDLRREVEQYGDDRKHANTMRMLSGCNVNLRRRINEKLFWFRVVRFGFTCFFRVLLSLFAKLILFCKRM